MIDGFNIYFRTQNLRDETNDVLHLLQKTFHAEKLNNVG